MFVRPDVRRYPIFVRNGRWVFLIVARKDPRKVS